MKLHIATRGLRFPICGGLVVGSYFGAGNSRKSYILGGESPLFGIGIAGNEEKGYKNYGKTL
jgi:hypothetical protein